jgi:hypothetical protein
MNQPQPAAWQHGIPLDRLRVFGDLFRQCHGPHVYGGFALAKERDVAEALATSRCMWGGPQTNTSTPQQVDACILYKVLQQPSTQHDFRGAPVRLAAGSTVVQHFAATSEDAGSLVLGRLRAGRQVRDGQPGLFAEPDFWVEAYEEDTVVRAVLADHGLAWQATKVLAGSEVKGLYADRAGRGLGADEQVTLVATATNTPSAPFMAELAAEAKAARTRAAQHYSAYNKRKTWTAVALRGYGGADFIVKPSEMSRGWKAGHPEMALVRPAWTDVGYACPAARRYVDALGFNLDRVRFMYLATGGELGRHADITDREAGVADGKVARLHLPIVTNPGVTFHAWDARGKERTLVPQVGQLFYLDQRKPHRVTNDGDTDRVHLVVDVHADERLRAALARGWEP